jgi:hypothetical protein
MRGLPNDVQVELECLSYGLRQVGGSLRGVDVHAGAARIVLDDHGVQQTASVGSVESIRCEVSDSPELAAQFWRVLPRSTPVVLETRSGDALAGLYDGGGDADDRVVHLDRRGGPQLVPAEDVVAVRLECL